MGPTYPQKSVKLETLVSVAERYTEEFKKPGLRGRPFLHTFPFTDSDRVKMETRPT